jgi:pimeloyl-ACP methyl ester carboxylesterase
MNPTKHLLRFQQHDTYYWEYGSANGPVMIMVHGFRGTHHGLEKIAEQLPQYRLIIPDLPGFGESDALAKGHDLEQYIEFVRALIASFGFTQPPILLGHSFGSIITSHYASRYPDTISKLVLINPIGAPALQGPRGVMTRLAIAYYVLGRILPARISKAWLGAPAIVKIMSLTMAKSKDKDMRKFVHDQHLQHFSTFADSQVVDQAFKASVNHDVRQVAPIIRTPTLLVAGELDDITSLEKQKQLHAAFPDGSLVVIDSVGHLIHYETPTEAAAAIDAFLSR